MNLKEEILNAKNDFDKIGDIIKNFSKENLFPNNEDLILVKEFLTHNDYYLRESSAYALFFMWQLNDEKIIDQGLNIIENDDEDFDVKKWVISGLAPIYKKHNDYILKRIFGIFLNEKDEILKSVLLDSILQMYGYSSSEILIKEFDANILYNSEDINDKLNLFKKEIQKIAKKG